jgi:hypothetical protein
MNLSQSIRDMVAMAGAKVTRSDNMQNPFADEPMEHPDQAKIWSLKQARANLADERLERIYRIAIICVGLNMFTALVALLLIFSR